jgi:hypothetical protein
LEKVFYEGSSKECRDRVRKLNELKNTRELEQDDFILDQITNPTNFALVEKPEIEVVANKKVSMWDRFLSDKDREELEQYSKPREPEDDD